MSHHRGDDLEDDFMPDETVVLSEDEAFGSSVGDPDDIGQLLSADEEEGNIESPMERTTGTLDEKKRRRREKEKERKAKKRKLNGTMESGDLDSSVVLRSPTMISEYLSAMQAKSFSKMSVLELQDRLIPGRELHSGHDCMDGVEELGHRTKSCGAPTLLFLTGAALRVADVTRALKSKTLQGEKGSGIAKLFAKHFKLEEHVKYLKKTKVGTAVGTPGRVGKLLCETDALSLSALTHVMLDVSYRDAKKRCLFDIPETRDEICKTVLGAPLVIERLKAGKIQIVLF